MGLLGQLKKGWVFIMSAPAGTGKTTLVDMLIKNYPTSIQRSVSCTTRAPRKGEKEAQDYFYLSLDDFQKKINEEAFLEYAEVFGNYYGTLKRSVQDIINSGKHVFLIIDTQGAMNLKSKIKATFIFLKPPSKEELERRLVRRAADSKSKIIERLSWADDEIKMAKYYDYVILNDQLSDAYQQLVEIIQEEERKHCF